jgi:hypothetical protein
MKEIELTQGQVTIVDDWNYEWLNQWKWCAEKRSRIYYVGRVFRQGKKQIHVHMHRIILEKKIRRELSSKDLCDHINHNGLCNVEDNLRIVTSQQSNFNIRVHNGSTSIYKGVSRKRNKWKAQIAINKETRFLGHFINPEDAAKAYDKAALEYFGEYAWLNFPGELK